MFTSSGIFTVPCGVHRVNVLVVGGGGGGGSGAAGGGASGFVHVGSFEVEPLMNVSITVGKGGAGSTRKTNNCTQVKIAILIDILCTRSISLKSQSL